MFYSLNNEVELSNGAKIDEGNDEEITDRIGRAARVYHLGAFPNPERIGCPGIETLKRSAAGGFPGKELRDHLFSCSPCFNEFRQLRLEYKTPIKADVLPTLASTTRFSLLSLASALLVLAFGFAMLHRKRRRGH